MRSKFSAAAILLVTAVLLLGAIPCHAEKPTENTVVEAQDLIDGILAYQGVSSSDGVQTWIDGYLTKSAGTSAEWYIISLAQYKKYDLSSYRSALLSYVKSNKVYSASSRLKYALCLAASGDDDGYISATLENSVGEQGLMSWIFGLHLLNNGYSGGKYTAEQVKAKLLDLRLNDGGWAVMGQYSDVDATAMAVQALAPFYSSDSDVRSAIDNALSLLSKCQLDDGDFAGYGSANPESTAQVMIALSSLGIDASKDDRFIKNGNTLFDGIAKYRLPDGSFCHKAGGASNATATVQVLCAAVSYLRMTGGRPSLYLLDSRFSNDDADTGLNTDVDTDFDSESTNKTESNDDLITDTRSPSDTEKGPSLDTAPIAPSQGFESAPTDTDSGNDNSEHGYKPLACLIIVCIGGAVCVLLFALKKRNIKNFIAVLILTAIALLIVCSTEIRSADEYYNGDSASKENAVGTVTLTIRCDTVAGRADHIPEDGTILDTTEFEIADGDTVYTVLTEAARKHKIQLENDGDATYVYISGIAYIYETEYGDLSGWMYYVNGECPSVGAGEYILKDGDRIEWLYTCALGEDLK